MTTIADIRRQAILRTLFPATSLGEAVRRLGLVQADPQARPARAQDLILRHRVTGYQSGDLERHYPTLGLDEDLLHVYGYVPAGVVPLLHPRTGQWRVEREHPDLAEQVVAFIQEVGEADHKALEARFGSPTTVGSWGRAAKATTRILEMLHYRGRLRVARRKGNVRTYAATPAPVSDLEPAERLRRLVLLLADLYAPIPKTTLQMIVRPFRWSAPSLTGRTQAVADLLKAGALEQAKVDGVTYLWPAGRWADGEVPATVRLLAPFDPVVWDRSRFEQLWGWPYRLEAYTPAPKRQFGHYALPILWGEQVIGWANLTYRAGRLETDLGFVNGRPADPAFDRELAAELERMTDFLASAPPLCADRRDD